MDYLLAILISALIAVPITMGLGVVYFTVAIGVVNMFRLNYGERPLAFTVLNWTIALTFLSYFLVFAFELWRFR